MAKKTTKKASKASIKTSAGATAISAMEPPENASNEPTDEEKLEFLKAMDAYKNRTGTQFPTWTQVLHIAKALGYRKD